MPRRTSLAPSEDDVDIFSSLYPGRGSDSAAAAAAANGAPLDLESIIDGPGPGDDGDDEAFIALQQAAAASSGRSSNINDKRGKGKKSGGFQSIGLNPTLLRAIARKGFSVPTPIQRKTIPLILQRRDVVAMARTGSGKTAAFVIPLIERLRAHSARVGSRALILSPSRELALQTLIVIKALARGTGLRAVLLVGGDSLEEQFGSVSSNPDIMVATPGRFLHLKVEMSLDLSGLEYVCFDEADRLFEMGFAPQLAEILHALPVSRQTLLFSATLPRSLVEFARAGLHEPTLVRLDAETKVSPDLQSAFFTVQGQDREGALLHILYDVIGIPPGVPTGGRAGASSGSTRKRKRGAGDGGDSGGRGRPTEHSTIVFAATKHRVEYLAALLAESGFAVSHVYGSLDQEARRLEVEAFRAGRTHILVVTDVAARGIDIPILANVVNFDFCTQPKMWVHRVGRTARAGQTGWSYNLIRDTEAPYLLDLQLFLGRRLVLGGREEQQQPSFSADVVAGSLPRSAVESHTEWVAKILDEKDDLNALRRVAGKAESLHVKTRNAASAESAKRARECVASRGWTEVHPLFAGRNEEREDGADQQDSARAREDMLARISGYRPQETIFEIHRRGKSDGSSHAAEVMKQLRKKVTPRGRQERQEQLAKEGETRRDTNLEVGQAAAVVDTGARDERSVEIENNNGLEDDRQDDGDDDYDDDEMEVEVTNGGGTGDSRTSFRDDEIYMSYTPRGANVHEERGYGVHSGGNSNPANFLDEARRAAMDLTNDEGAKAFGEPTRARMRWDHKQAKYVSVANDEDGSRGTGKGRGRMIRGESGVKIAASFRSGRFDKWRREHRVGPMPRVGELEKKGKGGQAGTGQRFRHQREDAPKEADKYRDDYLVQKRRVAEAREKRVGRFKLGPGDRKELKGVEDVRRARKVKERRRQKNARPSRR